METLSKLGVRAPTTWSQVLALCDKAKDADIAAYSLGIQSPLGTNYNASLPLVANGKAAGVVQGSWAFAPLRQANPKPTYKMFPLPATNNPGQTWMPGAANAGFAVNAKTKNPNAIRFVRFVASPAFQNAFAKASGSLPAYPSAGTRPDAGLALFVGYQRNGKTYPFPDQLWPNPKVQNAHLTGLQNIFAGKGTVAEMLSAMDQAYRSK